MMEVQHFPVWLFLAASAPVVRDVLTVVFAGLAAVGTVGATIAAVYYARRDRHDRELREHRRQAELVTAWMPPWKPILDNNFIAISRNRPIVVSNRSGNSIYEVGVGYGVAYRAGPAFIPGPGHNRFALQVPPGDWAIEGPPYEGGGMHMQIAATVSFRDSSGTSWIRGADGRLYELRATPLVALEEEQPYGEWAQPSRQAEFPISA